MDIKVVMRQDGLARASSRQLSSGLADHAIAIAMRTGKTPQEILRLASESVGFTEQEWREAVEPQIREFIERAQA